MKFKDIKVKLTVDLTRYDKRLVVGEIGYTKGPGRNDRFEWVKFNNGARLEVLWESLEVIDEERLKQAKQVREETIKNTTKEIKIMVGPKGEFQYIEYDYITKGIFI